MGEKVWNILAEEDIVVMDAELPVNVASGVGGTEFEGLEVLCFRSRRTVSENFLLFLFFFQKLTQ